MKLENIVKFVGRYKGAYKKRIEKYKKLDNEIRIRKLAYSLRNYLKKEYFIKATPTDELKKKIDELGVKINVQRALQEFNIPLKKHRYRILKLYLTDEQAEALRDNIKIYSTVKGVTTIEIGEKLSIVPHEVSQIIYGDRHKYISIKLAYEISKAIDVNLDTLIVKTPLELAPKVKEFLNEKKNEEYVKLLIDYLSSNRDELALKSFDMGLKI